MSTTLKTLASGSIATLNDHGRVIYIRRPDGTKSTPSVSAPRTAKSTKQEVLYAAFANGEENATTARCGGCGGTGQYVTGMENGKLVMPGGIHFRCEGHGVQTNCGAAAHRERFSQDYDGNGVCCDAVRNYAYDCWGIRWVI